MAYICSSYARLGSSRFLPKQEFQVVAPPVGSPPTTATRRLRLANLRLALDAVTLKDLHSWRVRDMEGRNLKRR
ncbi:hypothetical protein N665_3050s0003 [Sinapis alba]|nr:hypothetical protein N665_3050s0003 [Sinapis alba]